MQKFLSDRKDFFWMLITYPQFVIKGSAAKWVVSTEDLDKFFSKEKPATSFGRVKFRVALQKNNSATSDEWFFTASTNYWKLINRVLQSKIEFGNELVSEQITVFVYILGDVEQPDQGAVVVWS